MDWMTISGNIPCVALISLGAQYGDRYYISDECPHFLNEILEKLNDEEPSRDFRRALSFMDIINKDLIPILVNVKDQPAVFRSTVKVLVGLTIPVECLITSEGEASLQVVHELTQLIYNAKEAFLEPRATRALLDHLFPLVDKQPLSTEECEAINDCLLLLRNILHAPERPSSSTDSFKEKCAHLHLHNSVGCSFASAEKEKSPSAFASHGHGHTSQQNRLLWNLFSQGLDKLMLNLLASEQKGEWVVSIVQLIALFYKDQHVESMQKLIGSLLDSTTSDSSEDDESNTSPPGPGGHVSPQILTTSSSDPTSDSSDSALHSGATANVQPTSDCTEVDFQVSKSTQKLVKAAAAAAKYGDAASVATSVSDDVKSVAASTSSGVSSDHHPGTISADTAEDYAPEVKEKAKECSSKRRNSCLKGSHHSRQAKNEAACASGSTSSEDLRLFAKRPMLVGGKLRATNQEREKRRKSVIKRSCSMTRKKKSFGHYIPTDEDIAQLLKDFTVHFLLKGYDSLVVQLHQLLLEKNSLPLDKSHFFWLITYFLRFASQLELDIKHVKSVLSTDTLCLLTWQALAEAELLEVERLNENADLKPHLRRLHLAVTAIREFLQAMETYSRVSHLKEVDRQRVVELRSSLPTMRDLRQLFLLLIRHFNPLIQSPRYLRDVITTNHVLLLSLERSGSCGESRQFVLQDHMQQFCSRTVLKQYGLALEDYKTNGQFVNDCILTVLHHIGTDLGNADLLCEPVILRSFSRICDEEFELCDDWVDLIEFVCQRFLRNYQQDSSDYESDYKAKMISEDSSGSDQDMESADPQQHQQQDNRNAEVDEEPVVQDIKRLTGRLMESGMQQHLLWLQQQLLTLCSIKLQAKSGPIPAEIIASMSQRIQVSCPLVPWSDVQAAALRTEAFVLLLHRLGLGAETSAGIFPRIPFDWDCDTLYSVALELGPITEEMVTFDLGLVKQVQLPDPCDSDGLQAGSAPHWIPPYLGPGPGTSLSVMPHHWLHWVEQSGSLLRSAEKTSNGHSVSLSISNHSHRPMDSISTTSSLEVHKTDSSDNEEMEDIAPPASVEPLEDYAIRMEQDSVT